VAALGGLIIYLSKNPPIEILIQKFEVICTKPSQIVIRVAEKCNLFVALLQSNYFWINLGCFMPVGFLIQFGKKNKYFFFLVEIMGNERNEVRPLKNEF
jgi:hypothetical protein